MVGREVLGAVTVEAGMKRVAAKLKSLSAAQDYDIDGGAVDISTKVRAYARLDSCCG